MRRLSFLLGLWLLLSLWLSACSPHETRDTRIREALHDGDPREALKAFEDEDCASVDCLLSRGHLQLLAGDYGPAQRDLAAAEWLIQDLWTLDLSKEAVSLALNDEIRDYGGERFERVWVNFARALGYLAAGEPWEAAVEGRALTRKLTVLSDQGDDEREYRNDPFLQYFAGLLAEADGEINRAWINYRAAERLYAANEVYGVPAPGGLGRDLLRAAEQLAFSEEAENLRARYGNAEGPGPGEGELLILVSEGIVPEKITERINFPIIEVDDDEKDEDAGNRAWRVASHSYEHWGAGSVEVDYFVSVALPALAPSTPVPSLDWRAGSHHGELSLAADLGHLSRRNLQERYATVVLRSVARALVKYWASQKVEEKKGELAGILVNLLGMATEKADTRGWASLPERVHMARVILPAGRQLVRVGRTEAEVEVAAGRLSILHLRVD